MSEALEKQFLNSNTNRENFITRLADVIDYEWDRRQNTKFNCPAKKATLKYPTADLDSSHYDPDRMLDTHTIELLAKCELID